jgi:hypothetical protein
VTAFMQTVLFICLNALSYILVPFLAGVKEHMSNVSGNRGLMKVIVVSEM